MISKEDKNIRQPASLLTLYRFRGDEHVLNAEQNNKTGHPKTQAPVLL
ncbi:MAG: hypothetical protein LBE92_19805 [Chryseobacterium sp.]|jgi:hypothetical protein|nr:hypothetical protein [Chryseobacterium sp.]MDR2238377.1 hypothetical protein [Chryseobacterium sp.]